MFDLEGEEVKINDMTMVSRFVRHFVVKNMSSTKFADTAIIAYMIFGYMYSCLVARP